MRSIDADKLSADMYHEAFVKDSDMQKWDSGCWIRYKMFENVLKAQPTVQPETNCSEIPNNSDTIYRQQAIDALCWSECGRNNAECMYNGGTDFCVTCDNVREIKSLPSAQPFHNITMDDVLKYIDGMPEDVWQEFTACLECRGWELQRRTAKWCGGDFA